MKQISTEFIDKYMDENCDRLSRMSTKEQLKDVLNKFLAEPQKEKYIKNPIVLPDKARNWLYEVLMDFGIALDRTYKYISIHNVPTQYVRLWYDDTYYDSISHPGVNLWACLNANTKYELAELLRYDDNSSDKEFDRFLESLR